MRERVFLKGEAIPSDMIAVQVVTVPSYTVEPNRFLYHRGPVTSLMIYGGVIAVPRKLSVQMARCYCTDLSDPAEWDF